MVLATARVTLPYQPEERISQGQGEGAGVGEVGSADGDGCAGVGGLRRRARMGSVMSQIIHILPSRGSGAWPVKMWEGVAGVVSAAGTAEERRGRVWRLFDIDVVIVVVWFAGAGAVLLLLSLPLPLPLSLSSCSVMLDGSVRNMNV